MLTQATRKVEDPQFRYSNSAQVFAPTLPNPGVPVSHLPALAGGNVYGVSSANMGMFGSNSLEGAGQQVMNMGGGGNSERQRAAARNYSSPYSNPELEYLYLGSPKTPSPFLSPDFSFVSNNSHVLQPTPGNVFTHHHALVAAPVETGYLAPQNNFQAPPYPAQRVSGGVMEPKAQVQSPVAQGMYGMPTEPEMQYDDIWANLEADLFAQESAQQYNVSSGDIGMVEAFGFEPGASLPAPAASQAQPDQARPGQAHTRAITAGSSDNNIAAEYKRWAMLSQALPDEVEGLSSGQAGFTSTSTSSGKASTRRDPHGLPPRPAHHPADVAQNSNHGMYPLGVAEFQGGTAMDPRLDMMDMVMGDTVSDGVSSTEDRSRREVAHTQIPYGHSPQSTPGSAALRDAGGQRSSRPENNFREPQTNQQMSEQRGSYNASTGSTFNESMTMTNDFTQLLTPGLLGTGHLGETRWAVQLLNLCAAAIASQNISRTQHLMFVLNDLASVVGDVNQRFAAYGLRALFCRISDRNMEAASTFLRPRHNEQEMNFGPKTVHRALVRFHDYVPWHQNCYAASSQTLLEVCAGKSRLHLIDVGAGKGIEWPIFIDALVSRAGGPPSILRITMIRDHRREELNMTHAKSATSEAAGFMTRLVKFASGLGLNVEINMVTKALECVTREDLRLRNGEILAVVCQFRLHRLLEVVPERSSHSPVTSRRLFSPRDEFMDFVFKLNPHVFILSDNNTDQCSQDFLTRFQNVSGFWWNFYESLDMSYKDQDPEERLIIEYEAGVMMLNLVACEGIARIERNESHQQWSRRVMRAGFVPKDLSDDAKKACTSLVQNHSEFWDVATDEPNIVNLRWRKQPTTFTSVWQTPGSCSKSSCKCSMLHN